MKNIALLCVGLTLNGTLAFVPSKTKVPAQTALFSHNINRRHLLKSTIPASLGIAALFTNNLPAVAAGSPPTADELARVKKGYEQVQYLLANFEQETTTCRENGGECKRDAEPIRKVLGLRSTTDPLFQIDKVFNKVKYMDIDPDKLDAFFEAAEDWNSTMSMSNSMAFISQFGEYNPGGGKDAVLKYLNESKKQVELASTSLKVIMDCLGIE